MSAITAKASRKMKKYAVLTREPRCFLGSFDFSWEQRKLGDISEIKTGPFGSTLHADDYVSDGTPIITTEHFKTGALPRSKNGLPQVSDSDYKRLTAYTLDDGDIVFSRVGSVDINALITPFQSNWLFSGRVLRVRPQTDISSKFLHTRLETESIKTDIRTRAVGQTMPSINTEILKITPLVLPSSAAEQEQIGSYFAALDNLITLHQRKCVFLFGFFQAFISMIFTASTFSWEQRKLGELVDRVVRKNTNNESTLPLTISAQYGLVDQITYFNNRVASRDVSNYYLVLNGEFAYNKSTSDGYPFGAVKRLDLYEKGVLSTLYIVFAPKKEQQIDSDYLTVFFDTDRWHKGVAERAAEGARNHGLLNISAEDFFDIDLSVPKDIVEQKQIGAFIRQLDNLITLHQRECISFTARAGRRILTANKKRNTSSWEQRKFSDVVATRRGLTYKPSDIRKNGVRVLRSSNIAEDSFVLSDEDVFVVREAVNIDCVRANDILITAANGSSRLVGKHTIISGIPEESAVHGGFMLLGTTKEPHFVNASMGSSWYRRFIELFVAGGNGAIGNLNKNDLDNQDIAIPSEKEQKKIGSFFRQLDNLITLHQRKPFLMKWRTSDANRNKTNRLVL